ncbi:hypothetical protein BDW71DRAFT_30818 [Aspergillus fruticulosus]
MCSSALACQSATAHAKDHHCHQCPFLRTSPGDQQMTPCPLMNPSVYDAGLLQRIQSNCFRRNANAIRTRG